MTPQEILSLKEKIDGLVNKRNAILGKKELLSQQMKEQGFLSINEVKIEIEKLNKQSTSLKKQIEENKTKIFHYISEIENG